MKKISYLIPHTSYFILHTSCFVLLIVFLDSCHFLKLSKQDVQTINLDTITVVANVPTKIYHESNPRINDLLHTKLEIKFDWEKQYAYGKASLTLKPYFYAIDSLTLDAKGFDINTILLLTHNDSMIPLKYNYDSLQIHISLNKLYAACDTYTVFIDYTAKPNNLKTQGSESIKDAKGLYFINADGKTQNKPKEIWSQGETESNSCWFPTIDSPNERMTQEIYITVDTSYITLSNGLLEYSTMNTDGTRTDYWKQNLSAAPYLTMIAVGKYAVVKDHWRNIDVDYYVEPEYEKYAKSIFGHTPEMLEFFSNKLGVDYPWEKFSQIVVRDYISGAMENTTAVVHGEFMQQTDREILDHSSEDIIAHELFHQWFGDFVTCESWSNLPLNESFATYGQYLWNEYKYGKDAADYGLQQDLNTYLGEAKRTQVNLIRFYYNEKEDMFDGHSYQKGSRILHLLRKYVGDEAFFASLKLYLTSHKFSSVEIHDLRLAFEQVTGQDLNWFFNQWFFNHGHPELLINYAYNDSLKKETVTIKQVQNLEKTTLFKLPMAVDIYVNGKTERHKIMLDKATQEFSFAVSAKPDLVNVDAEKILLCTKKDNHSNKEWLYQYHYAPLYLDRYEAIQKLSAISDKDSLITQTIVGALHDTFWNIRVMAIKQLNKKMLAQHKEIKEVLMQLAKTDTKAKVRAEAIRALNKLYEDADLISLYRNAVNDSAYSVVGEALEVLAVRDTAEILSLAKKFEDENNATLFSSIANIYAERGSDEQNDYFEKIFPKQEGYEKYYFVQSYSKFLVKCKDETITKGLTLIEDIARNGSSWWVRFFAMQSMTEFVSEYKDRENITVEKIQKLKKENTSDRTEISRLEAALENIKKQKDAITELIKNVKKEEKDKNLRKIYDMEEKSAK